VDACGGTFPVTVIDSTHVDLQGSTYSAGVCAGLLSFGNLPMTWAVPGAYVYINNRWGPQGPILKITDMSVGASNATVVSFSVNGSAYAGGFPVLAQFTGTVPVIITHMAPSWSCIGCTGAVNVLDVNSPSAAGLPFGSYVSRVVTQANNNSGTFMWAIGSLTELDITVTAACSGASTFGIQTPNYQTIGSTTISSDWNPSINAATASATPRVMKPTTTSGAQTGDTLTSPAGGTNTWLPGVSTTQIAPAYGTVANCSSASTTVTFKTNQGVVYP
jgi:hypothetical protein